ncbi:DUF433 domain-containing protein [Jiella sonneratiae]|uniref:DUF433 domain-containing protein n=1 Tax=Jiella sonneratiae TaxID=2816856 RepID=A0ABS3J3D9_9HYPH|nr:DUF433 domain-containing protein [Jiella sonneratiae]MBO0904173.1 DUF433 domain-containing protein [Jiella sonneratiae]
MRIDQVISSDPEIMSGEVVFAGTRVPIDALFENIASGLSFEDFLDNFPTVTREQAQAALIFAGEHLKSFHRWQNFESAA